LPQEHKKLLIASFQPFHGSSPSAIIVHPQAPCNQTYLALAIINNLDQIFSSNIQILDSMHQIWQYIISNSPILHI
jgi:hypothetical protein